jgi:signal transduction histidine kinase/ActR/RegA family two-component response regulator
LIGLLVQAVLSTAMLCNLRYDLMRNRGLDAKQLDETAYSAVAYYYDLSQKKLMTVPAAQAAAKALIRSLHFDKTNYFFIWDLDGEGLAHGGLPALEGQNLLAPEAKRRLPFIADMVAKLVGVGLSPEHEGLTEYEMTKSGETVARSKLAYARLFKPWGWVIGTGLYTEDIDAVFWQEARAELLFALGVIALAGAACVLLARDLSNALLRVSSRVAGVAAGELDGAVPDTHRGDEVGDMARALLVLRDTSAEALQLKTEQAALKASSQAKSEFLATMSHEIRTPLNGVVGTIGLLSATDLNEDQANLVQIAHDSADTLLALINDVLDVSKLDAGAVELEEIDFSPERLATGVHDLFLAQARERGLAFSLDLAPDLPAWLRGDPTRLRQVFSNLVSNAIKFTPAGSVALSCAHRLRDDGRIELSLALRDTGIGLSEAARGKLFGMFCQADSSITRQFGGTGLGLAICKRLAGLMGGDIEVESRLGEGSTFRVVLPCRLGAAPPVGAAPASGVLGESLEGRSLRVLVAEDNAINQLVIRKILESFGCAVEVVGNGAEALARATETRFDLIFMDMHMPVMDGMSATRRIRALRSPQATTPIIALTADALSGQREQYLSAGMDDYVTKPIQPKLLLEAILRTTAPASPPIAAAG